MKSEIDGSPPNAGFASDHVMSRGGSRACCSTMNRATIPHETDLLLFAENDTKIKG